MDLSVGDRGGERSKWKRYKAIAMFAAITLVPSEVIAGCNDDTDALISGKNAFSCPVVLVPPLATAGVVRGPDACAKEGGRMDSNRGQGRKHNALDINSAKGTAVLATKPGLIAVSRNWDPDHKGTNMGEVVIIDHEDGDYSVYGHLDARSVKEGACVKVGQKIGTVGYTGNGACLEKNGLSPHLHFAIIRAAKAGLANPKNGPIAATIKNANDWLEFGADFWGNDIVDLGIKNPQPILKNIDRCISE